MGDVGDLYRDFHNDYKALRTKFGVPCPECVEKLPKACPSILLPQQRCRIHKYLDPRPESIMDNDRQFRRAY